MTQIYFELHEKETKICFKGCRIGFILNMCISRKAVIFNKAKILLSNIYIKIKLIFPAIMCFLKTFSYSLSICTAHVHFMYQVKPMGSLLKSK